MRRINVVVLVSVVLCLILLAGCQDLVIDKEKLFRPGKVSEIVGFLAGFGTTPAAGAGLAGDASATVQRGHESADGRHHGCVPGAVGLLRIADRFAAGDPVERYCGST